MAVTKYSYVKTVNQKQLRDEISASAITIAVDHLDQVGIALDIYMKDIISAGDIVILDGLVTDHVIDTSQVDDQVDDDGATVIRLKAAKKGATYHLHYLCFETSGQNSLKETDYTGASLNFSTISFFKYTLDMDGNPTNTLESCMEDMAEVTQVDFVPTHDYEIIGGEVRVYEKPIQDTFLYVIGAPDLPVPFGSKIMVQNCNLKFYGKGEPVKADGKVSKGMRYTNEGIPDGYGNKLRFYVRHHRGTNLELQARIEMFKL